DQLQRRARLLSRHPGSLAGPDTSQKMPDLLAEATRVVVIGGYALKGALSGPALEQVQPADVVNDALGAVHPEALIPGEPLRAPAERHLAHRSAGVFQQHHAAILGRARGETAARQSGAYPRHVTAEPAQDIQVVDAGAGNAPAAQLHRVVDPMP